MNKIFVWTTNLESKLKELYPTTLTQDIANEFNTTLSVVRNKVYLLGLKKDLKSSKL